jgi:hypothetical protein
MADSHQSLQVVTKKTMTLSRFVLCLASLALWGATMKRIQSLRKNRSQRSAHYASVDDDDDDDDDGAAAAAANSHEPSASSSLQDSDVYTSSDASADATAGGGEIKAGGELLSSRCASNGADNSSSDMSGEQRQQRPRLQQERMGSEEAAVRRIAAQVGREASEASSSSRGGSSYCSTARSWPALRAADEAVESTAMSSVVDEHMQLDADMDFVLRGRVSEEDDGMDETDFEQGLAALEERLNSAFVSVGHSKEESTETTNYVNSPELGEVKASIDDEGGHDDGDDVSAARRPPPTPVLLGTTSGRSVQSSRSSVGRYVVRWYKRTPRKYKVALWLIATLLVALSVLLGVLLSRDDDDGGGSGGDLDFPTVEPTASPTVVVATFAPTNTPTTAPVVTPVAVGSDAPTTARIPTAAPTSARMGTDAPSVERSESPTMVVETVAPTEGPTAAETNANTTAAPTATETESPTILPTQAPTVGGTGASPTTGACVDLEGTFLIEGEIRDCAWLAGTTFGRFVYCRPGEEPYDICLETCKNCPTNSSTEAPAVAESFAPVSAPIVTELPTTTAPNTDGATASPTATTTAAACVDLNGTFLVEGEMRDCAWLAATTFGRFVYCRPELEAYDICLETCDNCP